MTDTLRAQLDIIDSMLSGPNGEDLSAILSAIRGPDSGDERLKMSTTNHIRRMAFPITCSGYPKNKPGWVVETLPFNLSPGPDFKNNHFSRHITNAAAQALGIFP